MAGAGGFRLPAVGPGGVAGPGGGGVGAVVGGVFSLIFYRREIRLKPAMLAIPRGRRFETLFVNLGMILFFFVSVGLFLLS